MLSGEGNENGKKTTISLISKKTTLHVQHTFLYISLPLFCTTTTWNFQKLPSYTFYGGNVVPVVFTFFHSLIFTLVAARISHFLTAAKFVLPTNSSLSSALALCRSFSRGASLACRPLYFFSIFQICGHDNWSKLNTLDNTDTEIISAFRFRLYLSLLHKTRVAMRFSAKITSNYIWVAIPIGWVILHWYTCGAGGRRTRLRSRDYQNFPDR